MCVCVLCVCVCVCVCQTSPTNGTNVTQEQQKCHTWMIKCHSSHSHPTPSHINTHTCKPCTDRVNLCDEDTREALAWIPFSVANSSSSGRELMREIPIPSSKDTATCACVCVRACVRACMCLEGCTTCHTCAYQSKVTASDLCTSQETAQTEVMTNLLFTFLWL